MLTSCDYMFLSAHAWFQVQEGLGKEPAGGSARISCSLSYVSHRNSTVYPKVGLNRRKMHHFLALFWFFYFHYLLGSLIGAFFFLAAFALFGIETGLHRKYVAFLLATFEVSIFSPSNLIHSFLSLTLSHRMI